MDHVLQGFTDELVKLSARKSRSEREAAELRALYRDVKKKSQRGGIKGLDKIRGKGRQVSRDYLASALIGATATPAAALLGKRISRGLYNREIRKAMRGVSGKRRKALKRHLETGPVIGKSGPPLSKSAPMMTHAELAGHAARGGAMGSVIQMIRDRLAGSAGVGDRK